MARRLQDDYIMPKGIPKNGTNKGWFDHNPRPDKKTGVVKHCPCGKQFYCERGRIVRKKFCSKVCQWENRPLGLKRSKEARKNISLGKLGKKCSLEHRMSMSRARIGKKASAETREKKREAMINHYDKIGRKEHKRFYHFCSSREYQEWRNKVFVRDGFKCRICNCDGYLQAHHILRWVDFPELRYQVNNGITLCRAHHPRKRAEEKRLIPEFQALVSASKN